MSKDIIKAAGYLYRKGVLFEGQREFPGFEELQSSDMHHQIEKIKVLIKGSYEDDVYSIDKLRHVRFDVPKMGWMTVLYCSRRYEARRAITLGEKYYKGQQIKDYYLKNKVDFLDED